MYHRCVEGAGQQADLLSWREGDGSEDSDGQLLGQNFQTLQEIHLWLYSCLRSDQFYTLLFKYHEVEPSYEVTSSVQACGWIASCDEGCTDKCIPLMNSHITMNLKLSYR